MVDCIVREFMNMPQKTQLIYTLGMVQFPRIAKFEPFIDNFMDKIREDYPIDDHVSPKVYTTSIGPEGVQIDRQDTNVWQFTSIDRKWAFILTDQSICLHTSEYNVISEFKKRLQDGISKLIAIPDIGIKWLSAVGIRFVYMLIDKKGGSLNEIAKPWMLPTEPYSLPLEVIAGVYVSLYKTKFGELRLQSLRNPSVTLPPELINPMIQKNGWLKDIPKHDFAIIDLDHSFKWINPQKFEIKEVIKTIVNLEHTSREIILLTGLEMSKELDGSK